MKIRGTYTNHPMSDVCRDGRGEDVLNVICNFLQSSPYVNVKKIKSSDCLPVNSPTAIPLGLITGVKYEMRQTSNDDREGIF